MIRPRPEEHIADTNITKEGADVSSMIWTGQIFLLLGMVPGAPLSVEENDSRTLSIGRHMCIWLASHEDVCHIYDVFRADFLADAPCRSKTTSFLLSYPNRPFQFILKKVRHPKEVLLNFVLDICAVGYDGKMGKRFGC